MAQGLARAVGYVHIFGFVHKNLRPEVVLGFEAPEKESPSLFLVGFDKFRKKEGRTQRLGDGIVEENPYRHPSRHGINPSDDFIMQHDIYSLGVCLLEVGLWKSLIDHNTPNGQAALSSFFLDALPVALADASAQFLMSSAKDRLVEMARTRPPKVTQYANIVETCLTCLDPGNNGFGDKQEFEDEDGILVGVRYIEKVSTGT